MGKTKELFEQAQEFCSVEMTREFYEQHEDILKPPNTRIKSAYVKGRTPSGDKIYQEKIQAIIDARNELMEYEIKNEYKKYL